MIRLNGKIIKNFVLSCIIIFWFIIDYKYNKYSGNLIWNKNFLIIKNLIKLI